MWMSSGSEWCAGCARRNSNPLHTHNEEEDDRQPFTGLEDDALPYLRGVDDDPECD